MVIENLKNLSRFLIFLFDSMELVVQEILFQNRLSLFIIFHHLPMTLAGLVGSSKARTPFSFQ